MFRFVLRRFASMVVSLVGVSFITYMMVHLAPGDPAVQFYLEQNNEYPSPEQIERFRAEHGLEEPVLIQYLDWVWDVLHGELGQSYTWDVSVTRLIVQRIPETVELAIAAVVVALLIAVPAGVISAVHKDQLPDYISQSSSLLGISMPNFWLGYLLIIVFSLHLDLLPITGDETLRHLVLPAATLGTGGAAIITRLLRSSMLEVLDEDYIRTARSKGLRERIIVYKHALRNALIPVVTVIGLQLGWLLNGAVVVEIVFARSGLGTLLINAIFARDYPVIQGTTLLIAVVFVVVNFLVDISYRYIDPRIQIKGREP